jgi:hypothetical protein
MAFSIKQLLFVMLIVCVGLAALMNANVRFVSEFVCLLTLAIIVFAAYSIWISSGEPRAFFIGFVCWSVFYGTVFNWMADFRIEIGTHEALDVVAQAIDARHKSRRYEPAAEPAVDDLFGPPADLFGPSALGGLSYDRFFSIGHNLFALLFGLMGGWVTVYFHRKRQRMLAQRM